MAVGQVDSASERIKMGQDQARAGNGSDSARNYQNLDRTECQVVAGVYLPVLALFFLVVAYLPNL